MHTPGSDVGFFNRRRLCRLWCTGETTVNYDLTAVDFPPNRRFSRRCTGGVLVACTKFSFLEAGACAVPQRRHRLPGTGLHRLAEAPTARHSQRTVRASARS